MLNHSPGAGFLMSYRKFHRPRTITYSRLIPLAEAELWVREATGHNDGERVETYLSTVGLEKGAPWCAAFVSFIFKAAGYPLPRTGWSPSLFPVSRLVKAAAPGNIFGIYIPALKRIGHCGFVTRVNGQWLETIEGNTNVSGGREGDGVYRRKRRIRTIRYFSDWTRKEGLLQNGRINIRNDLKLKKKGVQDG